MCDRLASLIQMIEANDGINDKAYLSNLVAERFGLTRDRSVYFCADFAIRFSASSSRNFGNTVLSLSHLRRYDDCPFIVCLVTPSKNYCLIANTTFLRKISHSSLDLRINNIRGSFNGSDIMRDLGEIENCSENIQRLFEIHIGIGFEGNLPRLVEATNNISPSGTKFLISDAARDQILSAPQRAIGFITSPYVSALKEDLDSKVNKYKNEILLAALIENVNVRGRAIEYLIAGNDEGLRRDLIAALRSSSRGLPPFKTENTLGDYRKRYDAFDTETDVKTKIMMLNSNPKAYNLDKMLGFLASDHSVFMLYFVGIDPGRVVRTILVSMFQKDLLDATILLKHWAGRNSRGVSQFQGKAINALIEQPSTQIDELKAQAYLSQLIAL